MTDHVCVGKQCAHDSPVLISIVHSSQQCARESSVLHERYAQLTLQGAGVCNAPICTGRQCIAV